MATSFKPRNDGCSPPSRCTLQAYIRCETQVNSRAYCGFFNFKSADQQKTVNLLSGGERNRLNLARTLKQSGNLLILDGKWD